MIPPVASRFIAGETPAEALAHARDLNREGITAILNRLGEHYQTRGPADRDTAAYRQLVRDIANTDVEACLSVKPSQLGLGAGEEVYRENYRAVTAAAAEEDVFVWSDMEDASTTDATLDAYIDLAEEFDGGLGVCVQANLRRTADDLERLADVPGKIRLVKGAYDEPADIAYTDNERINEAYRENLQYMFQEFDSGIAVGSHDPAMLTEAKRLHEEYGTDFEVQMLMGVREDAQRELAAEGYDVYQYAPFGSQWLAYFYRRVRERKENLRFALRAILGR